MHWEAKRCLVWCTYRVLITANSLEPASSLEGIILNPITYQLRYATEAHNLSSSDGWDFYVMSPELQRTNSETQEEQGEQRVREWHIIAACAIGQGANFKIKPIKFCLWNTKKKSFVTPLQGVGIGHWSEKQTNKQTNKNNPTVFLEAIMYI